MPRFFTCLVAGMLLTAWLRRAEAQVDEPNVMLDWSSTEGCLNREALIAAVTRALPRNRIVRKHGDATIVGKAEREDDGAWSVLFVVLDSQGTRLGERRLRVEPPTCAALTEHVVVVSVMLVDSTLRNLGSAGPGFTSRESVTEASRAAVLASHVNPVAERSETSMATPAPRHHSMRLSVGASSDVHRLPSTSLGLRIGLGWGRSGETEITLAAALHPRAVVLAAEGGESTISWNSMDVAACHCLWRPHRLAIAVCAGMRMGAMAAKGSGFARNREPYELVVDGLLRAQGRRRLGTRFFVAASLAGYVALRRPRFGYENSVGVFETIHEPASLALGGTIALGVNFF